MDLKMLWKYFPTKIHDTSNICLLNSIRVFLYFKYSCTFSKFQSQATYYLSLCQKKKTLLYKYQCCKLLCGCPIEYRTSVYV